MIVSKLIQLMSQENIEVHEDIQESLHKFPRRLEISNESDIDLREVNITDWNQFMMFTQMKIMFIFISTYISRMKIMRF